jgi:hypothetical protein
MDLRVYEVLFQFNQAFDLALSSVVTLEKLEAQTPYCIARIREGLIELRAYANTHLASKIAQTENGEMEFYESCRRKRELAEVSPDLIYIRVAEAEYLRRERGLPPRAVVLPWTKADDDRALARMKTLQSAPPTQPAETQTAPIDASPIGPGKEKDVQS